MTKEGSFGMQEAICLLTITTVSKVFYTSPSMVMKVVGTAGWYMTLISAAIAAIALTPIFSLLNRFPGKNIMEIYDISLGKVGGSILSFLLFVIILITTAVNMKEFTEVLIVYVYPESPPGYIIGLLLLVIILAAYLGLESIARVSRLLGGILLFGLISVLILASKNYNISHLFPLLGYGAKPIIINGLLRSSAYGEMIVIGIFVRSLQGIKYIKKAACYSLILSGAIISISIFAFTLSFPYYTGKEITAPMYLMTTLISYGGFFQRLEAIFLFIWSISLLIALSFLFYMNLMIYCHIFNIKDKRPLILPLAIILYTLTMIPENMTSLITIYMQALRSYGWIFFYLPPGFALLAAVLRGKKGGAKSAKNS